MARVVRFHETGGPEVLKLEAIELPPPGPGEVQLAVKALGINRAEVMFREGAYLEDPRFPARPGYEAAGDVVAVGDGVTDIKVGDAASTVPSFMMNDHGVYGDLANVPAHAVQRHPEALGWAEAAAVWMMFTTAYGALIDIADLTPEDTVLIPAASSSVGLAAIQIANRVGALPVALTRTSAKRSVLEAEGAAHVIATEEEDLASRVRRITGGEGARVVFDPVGGPAVTELTEVMTEHGILFIYGALSTRPTPLPLFNVLSRTLTVRGYLLFEISTDPDRMARARQYINDGLADGSLRPVIAKTFPLDQIVEAHRYMESNEQIGKIVVTV